MPAFETSGRLQTAVLWRVTGVVDAYGENAVGEPEEIRVRWQRKRLDTLDAFGNQVTLDGLAVVNEEVAVGSRMFLGTLSDWTGTGSGDPDDEVMEVVKVSYTPDLKARNVRRTLGLKRYKHDPKQ